MRRSFSHKVGFIRQFNVLGVAVNLRVDCDGLYPHVPASPDNPAGDFAPVCYQYFTKHSLLLPRIKELQIRSTAPLGNLVNLDGSHQTPKYTPYG